VNGAKGSLKMDKHDFPPEIYTEWAVGVRSGDR